MNENTQVYFQPYSECLIYTTEKKETIFKWLDPNLGILMDIEDPETCIGVKLEMATFEDDNDDLLIHLINLKLRRRKGIIQKLKTAYSIFTRWRK